APVPASSCPPVRSRWVLAFARMGRPKRRRSDRVTPKGSTRPRHWSDGSGPPPGPPPGDLQRLVGPLVDDEHPLPLLMFASQLAELGVVHINQEGDERDLAEYCDLVDDLLDEPARESTALLMAMLPFLEWDEADNVREELSDRPVLDSPLWLPAVGQF